MKRILLSLLLLLALAPQASAQDSLSVKRHEVYLRVGSFLGLADTSCDPGTGQSYGIPFSMGYMWQLGKTWAVGASLSHLWVKDTDLVYYGHDDNGPLFGYTTSRDHLTLLMAEAKARWARHRRWNMYSRLALGPGLDIEKGGLEGSHTYLAVGFHVTPLAVEVGNDHVRGFLELGFGMQGVLNVGLAHRF